MNNNCVQPFENTNNCSVFLAHFIYYWHNEVSMLLLLYWEGGNNTGNNVEGDKAQEICNCATKRVVQGMGANKIANGIVTASQAAHGVQQIKTRFHRLNKVHPQCQAHSTRSSHDNENLMFKDLRKSCPFQVRANRSHEGFQDIKNSPLIGLDMERFFSWLQKLKKQIVMG